MNPIASLGLPPLPADLARVEEGLREAVRSDDQFLGEVAVHLVKAGGKRIRPALTLCAAYATAGTEQPASDEAVRGAVAVELVHLGSLYHDDVIDEAETRRGVPAVNARWSNIVAILAGDFLLARASELAASLGADVAGLLAGTIGELCRGQVLELQYLFDVDRTEDRYLAAIRGKTAALFATACRIGGMVNEIDGPTLDVLPDRRRRARRHRKRRHARQAGGQGPARRGVHPAGDLRARRLRRAARAHRPSTRSGRAATRP